VPLVAHPLLEAALPPFQGGCRLKDQASAQCCSHGQVQADPSDCSRTSGVGRLAAEARGAAPVGHHKHWRDGRLDNSFKVDEPIVKSSPCCFTVRIEALGREQQRIPKPIWRTRMQKESSAADLGWRA